jgi:hypothetical protein
MISLLAAGEGQKLILPVRIIPNPLKNPHLVLDGHLQGMNRSLIPLKMEK